MTCEEVGSRLLVSGSKISRLETGRRGIQPRDVRDLLDLYGVDDEDKREALMTLTRQARQKGWWHRYGEAIPEWFEVYVGLEAEASTLRTYEAELVPGLLQTVDYARAVHRAADTEGSSQEIERRLEIRMARQELLTRPASPRFWAVMNEAVIRRVVGGQGLMRLQLERLAEAAELPNVTLQILPFGAGAHAAMLSSFHVLEFPERVDPDVVYLENMTGALYLEKPAEVDRYILAFDHLKAKALDPDESVTLIARVAKELR